MKKLLKLVFGCTLSLMIVSQAWAAGGGGYSSTAVFPNMYAKGALYTASFPPVGNVPSGSLIGAWVNWNLSTSYTPVGLLTYLCYDSSLSQCLLLNSQSGSTTLFNKMKAGNTFVVARIVSGSGTLSPVMLGRMDQVIVNFTY